MTFEEFRDQMQEQLDAMSDFWEEGASKDKESFPKDLPFGDWLEQFDMFLKTV